MELDDEPVRCPRCDEGMGAFIRRAHAAGSGTADVRAAMCDQCGGVWLDGNAVTKAYPAFHGLVDRVAGAAEPEVEGSPPIAMCPRCKGMTQAFGFFDLVLDVCVDCHGLWVDGNELEDLARTADRADGLPAPTPRHRGYRDNAAAAVREGVLSCKRCDARIEVAGAQMTSEGPMCAGCGKAFRDAKFDAALQEYEPPKSPLFDLSIFKELIHGFPVVLGVAMSAGGSCRRCGCRGASRCGC